jgi:hypothetical protein
MQITSTEIAIASIVIALATFLWNKYKYQAEQANQWTCYKLEIESRLKDTETKVNLYWKSVEARMAKYVHSPHTPVIDKLLEKMQAGELGKEDVYELHKLLETGLQENLYDNDKAIGVILLLGGLDQRIYEISNKREVLPEICIKREHAHRFTVKLRGD